MRDVGAKLIWVVVVVVLLLRGGIDFADIDFSAFARTKTFPLIVAVRVPVATVWVGRAVGPAVGRAVGQVGMYRG